MSSLPILPTSVVGSHGKPGWWFTLVKAHEAGEAGPGDVDEMFDDAADTAIRDMETAGIDIITDGEVRRLDGYVDSYYAIIKGIQPLPVRRKAGPWGYDQQTRYEAVSRIETPAGGLGIIKEFEYLQAHTARRIKATCAGPLTFGSRIHPGKVYRGVVDVAERFAEVINAELKGLVAAGADFIQLDEPHGGMYADAPPRFEQGVNQVVEGIDAKIAVHVCFGNLYGRPFSAVRSFRNLYPTLRDLRASQIVLEFANRGMEDLRAWREFAGDLELGAGVIDVKAFKAESAADVAERIRAALEHVAPDKLWLNPDCGFWETPRWVAKLKLAALVEGARIVRKELGG